MKFNDLIKKIRNDFRLTQLSFANIVEVSRPQIANVEIDRSDAALPWIPMICERLQIAIYYDPSIGWEYEKINLPV